MFTAGTANEVFPATKMDPGVKWVVKNVTRRMGCPALSKRHRGTGFPKPSRETALGKRAGII